MPHEGQGAPTRLASGLAENQAKRRHPLYGLYRADEDRQRASYLALRRLLVPYIVPHRFEGNTKPNKLRRSRYGYGIGLNKAWLSDIMGHIRSAGQEHAWGPLAPSTEDDVVVGEPPGGLAARLWKDATRSGVRWPNFWERTVLEWILTSTGGFVLVDAPPEMATSQREEADMGLRPFVRWIPMSWVLDFGRSETGYRWIKIGETEDTRQPDDDEDEGLEERFILYELNDRGETEITRMDEEGEVLDSLLAGRFQDREGRPTLPLVPAHFGEHPEIPFLGSGLLMGLDDIVIDSFNVLAEVREGFSGLVISLLAYDGTEYDQVKEQLEDGSLLLELGPDATLDRISADAEQVRVGLELLEANAKHWSVSAKRKVAEAMERAEARSGVSLKAEFQLDLRPLLTEIAETLDEVEGNAMWILAQMAGLDAKPGDIGTARDTTFQLEDEASRIARLVDEFTRSLPLPEEAKVAIAMRWLESSGLVDLEQELESADADGSRIARDVFEDQMREAVDSERRERALRTSFFGGDGAGA